MAEGFITRKGGVATEATAAPTLNFVSKTDTEIVFTITNNDAATVDIFWEVDDNTPDANTFELAGETTSGNITASGLDGDTEYTIFSFANAAGKAGSGTASFTQTTNAPQSYINATGGTVNTYQENGKFYKSHTFTSSGTFNVSSLATTKNELDYLIIAGGGGGGEREAGGAGAGGYRTTVGTSGGNSSPESKITATAQSYTITIGSGGVGGLSGTSVSQNGSNSSAFGIISTGGGIGAGNNNASNGASGGGAKFNKTTPGTGISGQGFNGGGHSGIAGSNRVAGAGGGGAGEAGFFCNSIDNGTKGGDGLPSTIRNGTIEYRAGGGGGGIANSSNGSPGFGGLGGGGKGSKTLRAEDGYINTGSGGGGAGAGTSPQGGKGGSGIVIIRYEVGAL